MKTLSFIIPAYNSEAFLRKCLDSMLSPEVLARLDILVVNDGSTDATPTIAQEYCRRYPDSVCLLSQENKGHGGALNTGCAAARGKYLKVIDADDWVVTENLPAFLAALEACESDVVLTHYHTIDVTTGETKSWRSFPEAFGAQIDFAKIMADWRGYDRSLTFHGITYRSDFYREHGHALLEHVFYEDHEYATFPCCYAGSITPLDLFVYEYRIGDVNQSVAAANQLKRIGHTQDVLQRMAELLHALPESDGKRYAAMKTQGLLLSYLTTALLVCPDRRQGRRLAEAEMARMAALAPEVCRLVGTKYRVFRLFGRLHISKSTWDRILASRLYNSLRGNHSFN